MQRELDIRAGVTRQLQAELDKVRSGPLGSAASDGPPEVVVTDMLPPPPRGPAMSAHLQQMAEKEDMRAWRHAASHKRWFATGRRPVESTVPRHGMQAVLQEIVEVTPAAHGMLQDLSGIDVLRFAAPGESPGAVDIPLPDRLDILVRAVMKTISHVVPTGVHLSADRVAALGAAFLRGLEGLRRHTNDYHRGLMRVPQNYSVLATYVNKDVNKWAGQLYEASSDFAAQHGLPPPVGAFPDVVVPAWTRLTSYIGAGGLINSQRHLPASDWSSGRRSSATLLAKGGYCFGFASDGGCSRPANLCRWEHAIDPASQGGRGGGSGRGSDGGNRRARGRCNNSGSNGSNGGDNNGGSSADGAGGGCGSGGGGRAGSGSSASNCGHGFVG